MQYDVSECKVINARDVHRQEIFSISITKDFTMLLTCSRDGTCKLFHPETFDEIMKLMNWIKLSFTDFRT